MHRIIHNKRLLHSELSFDLNGLFYRTQNELGRFRSERSYGDFFEALLKENYIQYVRESRLAPAFAGERNERNIPDFVVAGKVVVDFKVKRLIEATDYAQMQRYLSVTGLELGLIVNFGQKYVVVKRVLNHSLRPPSDTSSPSAIRHIRTYS